MVVVVVVENGGGTGGVMEKRRIVRGLVSAVRHVLWLCPVFFFGNRLGRSALSPPRNGTIDNPARGGWFQESRDDLIRG